MHISDGFVIGPINLVTGITSLGALIYAVRQAHKTFLEHQVPLLGASAILILLIQMWNFPLIGGTTGHFLGLMLVAALLGPWQAFLIMATLLVIQWLVFSLGGYATLGANLFNLGVLAGMGGYALLQWGKRLLPKNLSGYLAALGMATWISSVISATACAAEQAASGVIPWARGLGVIVGHQAIIGLGEALFTMGLVLLCLKTRPDMVVSYCCGGLDEREACQKALPLLGL